MGTAAEATAIREIAPLARPPHARVRVPGSKSITNRALVVAALSDGQTTLSNALFSDDSRYLVESLSRLGFEVALDQDGARMQVRGLAGRIPASRAELYVGYSGTSARFLTAMLALGHGEYLVDGAPRTRQRPIADLLSALSQLGVDAVSVNGTGCPPVRVRASGLRGGRATIPGDASSQYLSGLLMAAPYAESDVTLEVTGELASKPYVDMTIGLMADFGVRVERTEYREFVVRAGQRYRARDTSVEADASTASYFFAAAAVTGGVVRVEGVAPGSRQGDVAFLDVLRQMGCSIRSGADWSEVGGPERLMGIDVDMNAISDTAPTLAAIAPLASSPVTVRGIANVRIKESDRIAAVVTELRRLGVRAEERSDGFIVHPADQIRPALIQTYDDHRMAMAFSVLGLRVPGVRIADPGCVSKTFPEFFDVLETLRGQAC